MYLGIHTYIYEKDEPNLRERMVMDIGGAGVRKKKGNDIIIISIIKTVYKK